MTSEKMFVTTEPALPAKCIVCNNDAKEGQGFIDFGVNFDYYGAILICPLCIVNAAKLVDMVPVADLNRAEGNLEVATELLISANRKIRILESIVAAYSSDDNFSIESLVSNYLDVPLEFETSDDVDASSDSTSSEQSESAESATV